MAASTPVYDPREPAQAQDWSFDCSQQSASWALWSYGRTPDDDWMESSMIASGTMSPAVGLCDASGAGLASWLNEQYGMDGYVSSNDGSVSFDDVAAEAATLKHPLMLGGRGWGHWSGCRAYDPVADLLLLANPADGYRDVYQTLDRQQFAQLGTFSLVRLTHPASEGGGTAPTILGGIDVSSHQRSVDWTAVAAAGVRFGWTKATGGEWYDNPSFAEAWAGIKAAGLVRGAYHFAFETSGEPGGDAVREADYFLAAISAVGGLEAGDLVCLDIEDGPDTALGGWALAWCRRVEERTGTKPFVYTGRWFADPHQFDRTPELSAYPLWLAEYTTSEPAAPAPWSHLTMWQFTASGSVPGVAGDCDQNLYRGTAHDLAALGYQGGTVDDPYAPWLGHIGSGLLDMMQADGVLPAQSASTWLPLGSPAADVEEAYAEDGTLYVWLLTTNSGYRHRPA